MTKRSKQRQYPRESCKFSTIHVPSGKPGRRFNPKSYATGQGTFGVGIRGRREGDGGSNPWAQALENWKRP